MKFSMDMKCVLCLLLATVFIEYFRVLALGITVMLDWA